MPQIQHAEAGPRTRALFSALLAAFIFLPAFAGFPENSAAAEEEPQLLSARGEDELRGVLSAGRRTIFNGRNSATARRSSRIFTSP